MIAKSALGRVALGLALCCLLRQLENARGVESGRPLVSAVLEAGGSCPEKRASCERRFRNFADQLRTSGRLAGTPRQNAETIHAFVHEQILRGPYQSGGSDLAVVLEGGPFNCATASALFLALAAEFGLEARAVTVPGHVWCRVGGGRESFDVETTCRDWFDCVARSAAVAPERASRVVSEHRHRAEQGRELEERAFVAIFHYNRGVRLLNEGRFPEAIVANLSALRLDPRCQQAGDNFLATVNDWALALASDGQTTRALDLLVKGLAVDPDYQPFQANLRFLSQKQPDAAAPTNAVGPVATGRDRP